MVLRGKRRRILHEVRRAFLWLAVGAGYPTATLAHEFWIEPSSFTSKPGERVDIALRVGERYVGEPVRRKAERIERFAAILVDETSDQAREYEVTGEEGDDPAGRLLPDRPGWFIVIYDSHYAQIKLEANAFDDYLSEKGLDAIRRQRTEKKQNAGQVHEFYSRCAKSLIRVGEPASDVTSRPPDRPVGMPLEIVALFDPCARTGSKEGRFRVLFEGRPLSDVQITAQSRGRDGEIQKARTNEQGEVTFRLDRAGPWLIEGTHMRPAPPSLDADYESFWASLTFENAGGRTVSGGASEPST